jgi:hypothetical protein
VAAVALAAIAGCAASSSSTASGASPAPPSPVSAVQLAAKTTAAVKSVTGTFTMHVTTKAGAAGGSGSVAADATFTEQLRPALLADINISSMTAAGTALPGGMRELLTGKTLYLQASFLTQALHLSKPWLAIPLTEYGQSTGIDLSQLLNQVTENGPVNQAQLLSGATSVRKVGTGTLDGVAVTEYTGTISLAKSLAKFSGSTKTQLSQAIKTAGLTTASFQVWVDADNVTRKVVMTENGTNLSETVACTITSVNQPVTITAPPADQTQQVPAGALSGS